MKNETAANKDEFLTFEQMQSIALEIDSLLEAAMATCGTEDPHDHSSLIEMAQNRASRLEEALDPVYVKRILEHEGARAKD